MEDLNLEKTIIALTLKALNKSKTKVEAAKRLGITSRHIYNIIKKHNLILTKPQWIKDER